MIFSVQNTSRAISRHPMQTFTAKEVKNRLGQVFESATSSPVEITKNGRVFAYLLSADDYWKLTGGNKLSDKEMRDVLIDMMNGEISVAGAMKVLYVTKRCDLNKMSTRLGVGVRDKLMTEKHDRRNAFFAKVDKGEARPSDAFLFADAAVKCRGRAKYRSTEY
jgi:prevent-host-death family protein